MKPNAMFRTFGDLVDGYYLKRCVAYKFSAGDFLTTLRHFIANYRPGHVSHAGEQSIRNGVRLGQRYESAAGLGTCGVIGAQDLTPQKARLLLLLSLATTHNEHRIQGWFHTFGTGEFTARR